MAHTGAVDVGSHGDHDCHRAFHVIDDRHVAAVHSGRRVALTPCPAHFCQTRSCCCSRRLCGECEAASTSAYLRDL